MSTTNTYTYDTCNKLTQKLQQNSVESLISSVSITPSTAYVNPGGTVTFTVSAKDDNKEVVPDSVLANTQWGCKSPYFSFFPNTIGKTVTGVCTYGEGDYYISDPETSTLLQDSKTGNNKNESTTSKAVEQSLIIYPPSGYTAVPITATINGSVGKATVYVYLGTTTTTTLTTTGDITTTYTYDMNGNLIQEKQQEGTTIKTESFQYNELNQMIAYTSPTGSTTTYSYSPNGLRKSKTTDTTTTDTTTTGYYLDGDNVILETTNGSLSARNIRGINQLARRDSMGTIKNTYDHDIYGKEKAVSEGDLANPARYSGEYYDSESGMYYLRARYYDPEIARFISEDSYEGNNQDPLSLNLYTYCRNNPITRIDPSGNADLTIFNGATGDGGGGSMD